MGKVGLISLFLLLNTYISPLYSANNPSVTFTKENDGTHTFLIDFKFSYHGNIDNALKKLTNFENLKDLNPTIKDSYVEKSSLDVYFVRSKFRDCVLFICRNISMLEKVTYSCSTSIKCKIYSAVVSEDNNDINSDKDLKATKQSGLFRCMEDKINSKIEKAHGCKNPDECFIDENNKRIFRPCIS
mgnify:CR=1 FL=1